VDNSSDDLNYVNILKKTVQEATIAQPSLQKIELYPVCDPDSGNFLVLATGWDKQQRLDSIMFHARLCDRQIIIETDNFEEGLSDTLVAAGVRGKDIITSWQQAFEEQLDVK
jgi:hypothetical protein